MPSSPASVFGTQAQAQLPPCAQEQFLSKLILVSVPLSPANKVSLLGPADCIATIRRYSTQKHTRAYRTLATALAEFSHVATDILLKGRDCDERIKSINTIARMLAVKFDIKLLEVATTSLRNLGLNPSAHALEVDLMLRAERQQLPGSCNYPFRAVDAVPDSDHLSALREFPLASSVNDQWLNILAYSLYSVTYFWRKALPMIAEFYKIGVQQICIEYPDRAVYLFDNAIELGSTFPAHLVIGAIDLRHDEWYQPRLQAAVSLISCV